MEEAQTHRQENPQAAARYEAAQTEWEDAFREFKVATETFSVTVRKLHYERESGALGKPD